MLSSFSVNDVTYNVIIRQPSQNFGLMTAAVVGAAWELGVQSSTGSLYQFKVSYPGIRGSSINPDNYWRDIEMVKEAFTSDPEGVKPNTTYEINAKSAPYDPILARMP